MVLDAARDIVATEGLRDLSTRKVANRIGYSVGTLYNHFENLDDLIVQVNAETLDLLYEDLLGLEISGDPEDDLLDLANGYYAFIDRHFLLWNTLFQHRLPEGQDLPDWYQVKVDRLLELVARRLAPLFSATQQDEIDMKARVLWGAVHGLCVLARTDKLALITDKGAEDLWRDLIGNYLRGLRSAGD